MDKSGDHGAMLLDLGMDEGPSAASQLQFQEFPTSHAVVAELDVTTSAKDKTNVSFNVPDSQAQPETDEKSASGGPSFWTFAYYQQFFDVNTDQVVKRLLSSVIPRPAPSPSLTDEEDTPPSPDLYGPVWVSVTLVFVTAVCRNLASYQQFTHEHLSPQHHWRYDFHTVTYAATGVLCYAWLVPTLVWGVLWWQGQQAKVSLAELLCLYGYSLAVFIPLAAVCAAPLGWFRWVLLALGAALSGSVLALRVWRAAGSKLALPLALLVLAAHGALALLIYMFNVPPEGPALLVPTSLPPVAPTQHALNSTAHA